jgi:hypothetical protein
MEYIDRDERAIEAHCTDLVRCGQFAYYRQIPITYLPPQKLPRWARQVTAAPRGTSLGNGHYVRQGVNHA